MTWLTDLKFWEEAAQWCVLGFLLYRQRRAIYRIPDRLGPVSTRRFMSPF